jgi:ribosomal protein S18 acetylase RimI-like enzyme
MFVVAEYDDAHFDGVDALWREAFPDDAPRNTAALAIPQKLSCQRELFLVATEEGGVIGSVMAGYDGHRGWISRVAVLRSHRHRGVARAMMIDAEQRLAALGAPKINLQVNTPNAVVVSFYERLGYVIEPRISMGKLVSAPDSALAAKP